MMRRMKRILCGLLALALLLGAQTAMAVGNGSPRIYMHDGRVTLIDGACVDTQVNSFEDAASVVRTVLGDLGGDSQTVLTPWRTLTDAFGNRYYVFQQMLDDTTVLGGAVKVITDWAGNMLGLSSSIVSGLPDAEQGESITAEEAEQVVLYYGLFVRQQLLTVVDGLTERMILPISAGPYAESDSLEGSRYVWVVYTDNPDSSQTYSSDYPYLAHYVTLAGEYLYSLPTIMPGDEASMSGFNTSHIFDSMEPVDYSGYVELSTGETQQISVTLMRDRDTGIYYMGNIERRIIVADCWEFMYGSGQVAVEASYENDGWDAAGMLSLYNYCRAYDYYKAIGWSGGDGLDTPILILNNYCDANGTPVDNAAYVGGYNGWQVFLSSRVNDYAQCLDVLAHEYTHCVTGSVMTYNAYMNDYGAINEAISDIQGKTCEMLMYGRENVTWDIGDKGVSRIRSMNDPHRFQQPEFTWDVYYMPNVKTPTLLNDQGGVHTNSSLLNEVAWRLYERGGMTPEEGRAFWFTVDCAMVPGTDYPQLAELLPWALRAAGLGRYEDELWQALNATRLGQETLPDTFDADRALLTINLPETEAFDDEQWIMQVFSVNVDRLIECSGEIIAHVILGDYSVLPSFAQRILEPDGGQESGGEGGLLGSLFNTFLSEDGEDAGDSPASDSGEPKSVQAELIEWIRQRFSGVFYTASTNAGQDGHTMRMVCVPGHAIPVLLHGVWNEATSSLEESWMLIYFGDQWIDLTAAGGESEAGADTDMEALVERVFDAFTNLSNINDTLSLFFFRIQGGGNNVVPTNGLEMIQPA